MKNGITKQAHTGQVSGPGKLKCTYTVPAGTAVHQKTEAHQWSVNPEDIPGMVRNGMDWHDATYYGFNVPAEIVEVQP